MKILLVQLSLGAAMLVGRKATTHQAVDEPPGSPSQLYQGFDPPALEMVASCVPEHHQVRILDMRAEAGDALEDQIAAYQPDLVGVSCRFTCATNSALRAVQRIRAAAPSTFIIVGGHAPTLAPENFEHVDAIAIGEGEVILPPLLERLEQGKEWRDLPGLAHRVDGALCMPASGPMLVDDLNKLPSLAERELARPANDSRPASQQVRAISTSRGCPFRCSYCAVSRMYRGRYRWMSAERAMREIENTPADFIVYLDDTFLSNVPRARRIAELLLERRVEKKHFFQARSDSIAHHSDVIALWRQAGLTDVFVGLESADDGRLATMRKTSTVDINRRAVDILHDNGIRIWAGLIIEPDFDEQDFDRLRRFMDETQLDVPFLYIMTPYPGTELWARHSHELLTHNWDYFDTRHAVIPTRLPLNRFYQLCRELEMSTVMAMRRLTGGSQARHGEQT